MEQYELYIHSNAVEANCTEIEKQYSSGSRFCRRKQDFLVSKVQIGFQGDCNSGSVERGVRIDS